MRSLREQTPQTERAPAQLAVVWCRDWTTFAARSGIASHVAFEPVVRAVGRDVADIEVVEPGLLVCGAGGAARRAGGMQRLVARLDGAIRGALHGINNNVNGNTNNIGIDVGIGVGEGRLAAAPSDCRGCR